MDRTKRTVFATTTTTNADGVWLDMDNITAANGTLHDEKITDFQRVLMVSVFATVTALSIAGNLGVLLHILVKKLYRNFVSSHYIGHLMFVNLFATIYLLPIYVHALASDADAHHYYVAAEWPCRLHALLMITVWTVVYFMVACIAGVHLITFARIHYEQLFGLSPNIICALAWLAGVALGLPCLTNASVVHYDPRFYHCTFEPSDVTYRFLAYTLLLGVLLPVALTCYAYMRVLAIFYHAPVVFEALGIFRSRYLIFAFILNQFTQVPFYVFVVLPKERFPMSPIVYPVVMFVAYSMSIFSCLFYGLSLHLMKEDDIALTHRAHRGAQGNYMPPGVEAPQL